MRAYESAAYSVHDTGRTTAGGKPIRALYVTVRRMRDGAVQHRPTYTTELVEGVEDMQLATASCPPAGMPPSSITPTNTATPAPSPIGAALVGVRNLLMR